MLIRLRSRCKITRFGLSSRETGIKRQTNERAGAPARARGAFAGEVSQADAPVSSFPTLSPSFYITIYTDIVHLTDHPDFSIGTSVPNRAPPFPLLLGGQPVPLFRQTASSNIDRLILSSPLFNPFLLLFFFFFFVRSSRSIVRRRWS